MSVVELDRVATEVSPADVLNRAADLVEEHGLAKHVMVGGDGSLCAVQAMTRAHLLAGHPLTWNELHDPVKALLPKTQSIAFWNDRPERTKEQVVALLREAATCAS